MVGYLLCIDIGFIAAEFSKMKKTEAAKQNMHFWESITIIIVAGGASTSSFLVKMYMFKLLF